MGEGVLKVVSNRELDEQQAVTDAASAEAQAGETDQSRAEDNLAAHIREKFYHFRWHRTTINLDRRYIAALRAYNGEYDPNRLREIKKFGGSDVYARITSTKCRGATALLRDVYLGGQRPWTINASPVRDVPRDIMEDIE
jgi:hypothetical protein